LTQEPSTEGLYKRVSAKVDEWLRYHPDEWFGFDDIVKYFEWREKETKDQVSKKLYYEVTKKTPVLKKKGKLYHIIDREYDLLDFKTKNSTGFFDIRYPFSLEKYVKTPRRSISVLGGSPQAGKTAFVHNLIALNVNTNRIILFDSENSDAELEERLNKHEGYLDWPDDLVRSRSADFDDVIEPDALNIIDYLEAPENIWEIRTLLRNIRDKLTTGVAFINLQKPEGRDLPYGKDWAKQLPRLVLSMEGGILKILKGKSWADREVNPDGLRFSFKLVGGEKFVNIQSLGKEQVF